MKGHTMLSIFAFRLFKTGVCACVCVLRAGFVGLPVRDFVFIHFIYIYNIVYAVV